MQNISYEDINIIHEDNHILVVVKPQNVPCAPDSTGDADLLGLLKEYIKVTYDKQGEVFLALVHRLDRPTGGVMVYAKTSKAASRFSEGLKNGDVEKKYLVVVHGRMKERQAELTHYLLKDETRNISFTVPMATEGAKKAMLSYKTLDENDEEGLSLLSVRLYTGRSHQIRVQLTATGHSVFGDQKYNSGKEELCNLALWATELKFTHPVTKERLAFRVYPPTTERPWNLFDVNRFLMLSIKN